MAIEVLKSSGLRERFDLQKLTASLMRSGAPPDVAADIAREIEQQISPSSQTGEIYRKAKRLLRKFNHASEMRYSIKKALFSLGPSGYPFEKYFGKILEHYGYTVEIGRMVEGYCVSHEVDVLAKTKNTSSVIECKYHSDAGKATDVKTALYVHARFLDIRRKAAEPASVADRISHEGWLVTNTRCTTDAIRYAECAGLRIVSWKYPEKGSLERLIEDKRLYPVTILHSLKRGILDTLFRAGIILAQDIADLEHEAFVRKTGLEEPIARVLKKEADAVCPCTAP